MATAITGFRFVKCPKCKNILAEFANVPVYQCAACNTTLKAKNYDVSRQNSIVGSTENKLQNVPDSGSFDDGLPSSENGTNVCASKDGVQNAASPNPQSSDLDSSNNCCKKEDESEHEESCIEERGTVLQILGLSDERNDVHIKMKNDSDYKLQGHMDSSYEVEKSSKLCQQGHESMKLSERIQDFAESTTSIESASEDDGNNRGNHDVHGTMSRSTTMNSNPYDGSVSSGYDRCNGRKRIGISRRTFRPRKIQDSSDANEHKEGINKMTAGTQVQAQEVSRETSNEKSAAVDSFVSNENELSTKSAVVDSFDSNANELPTKNRSHIRRDTSLDSEDFHSVQNWLEPENDEPSSRSPFKDAELLEGSANDHNGSPSPGLDSLEHIQKEILRKVDELREEISEMFDKSDEDKGRSHLRAIQEEKPTKHLDPDLIQLPAQAYWQRKDVPRQHRLTDIPSGLPQTTCMRCHHQECQTSVKLPKGICRAYHHDMACKTCNTLGPRRQPCYHESQIEHEPEKSYNKEKRQQVQRHCRPILGGAPFVICYNCLQLLQLPMDFFVVQKKLYKLQCGACSKVLLFSFRAHNHRIPCMPNVVEHSTSEVDSSTDTTIRHEVSDSPLNDRSQSESASHSEDYGLSLGINYSPDVELPSHMPSNNSSLMERRNDKLITGSQLHLLMGYGSASELLYRQSNISEEFEFTEPTTPHCNSPEETFEGDGSKEKATCIPDDLTSEQFQDFVDAEDGDESQERLKTRRAGSPLHGLLKIMKLRLLRKTGRENSDQ